MKPAVILGHNQFIGVHYSDSEAGREKAALFRDVSKIVDLVRYSKELGVNGLMFSNNALTKNVVSSLSDDGITFYPILPYMRRYATEASSKGLVNLVYDIVRNASWNVRARIAIKGSAYLLKRNPLRILETLIDVEMLPFAETKLGVVFLHNEITNLALAVGARSVLEHFRDYVEDKYRARAGFGTNNLCVAIQKFKDWGFKNPTIMAPFNKLGFLMTGSLEENQACLENSSARLVAMSTLAGGRLQPKDAFSYVLRIANLESIVVGYSTRTHAEETIGAIELAARESKL